MVSRHYKIERDEREKFIEEYLHGDGLMVDGFIIDREHFNGAEVHSVTDKGVIVIHNLMTGKLITKFIARPHQIKRYYKAAGRTPPSEYKSILQLARLHQKLGYNEL